MFKSRLLTLHITSFQNSCLILNISNFNVSNSIIRQNIVKTHLSAVSSANPATTAVTTSVAVQCEDCTYEIEQANSPEASTLSPASSSASSCSTCSSATAEQRKSLNFLKRTTIMKRETIPEVDEEGNYDEDNSTNSPAIISV